MQQFGRDSIGPNHEMYEYSRGILERSTGRLVDIAFSSTQAFGFSVDGVVPPDDVAGFHAMDVLQHFELVPEAAAITRNLKKIVEFLCERKCLFCLDSDSLRESCGVYVSSHLLEWLWNVALDALPYQSETLASHADAFVTCIEEGWDPHDYVEERIVLTAAMAFKHMPSAIIARNASTFLDILQDLDKYGDDCIVLDAAMEVLDLMDSALLAASCLDELLLMLDPSKHICVYGCQVALELLAKLGPVVTVARADPIVACVTSANPPSDKYYTQGYIYSLARSRVTCCRNQMAALETLSKLEPNSLIEHADTLSWLLKCDSPPATSDELTLLKEKYPDEPSLADVKARANEMLDALYMPGGSGSDAAKASFEAQAQAMGT